MRKLVTQAFQRNIKAYFDRWRNKNRSSKGQENGADRILKKIRCRLLRMAWTRYRYGIAWADQEARYEHRLGEVKVRLDYKQKKRTFNAIRLFARNHKTAKKYAKTLIKGIDKHDKEAAFRRWRDFSHQERINILTEEQGQLITELNNMTQLDGSTSNKLQKAKDKSSRSATVFKTQCQKTLQKWAQRLHGNSMNWAFITWKQNVANLSHRERLVASLRR